jgi:hypothetical protein
MTSGTTGTFEVRTISEVEPWPGLASYREADSELFFGREKEGEHLLRLLNREVLTVLFGPSGTGKTSLLNAGLFPKLRSVGFLPVYLRLDYVSQAPHAAAVKAAVLHAVGANGFELEESAGSEGETLWEFLHRIVIWDQRNHPVIPVLVFDQFEEIFTLGRNRPASAEFITELADVVENYVPKRVEARLSANGSKLPFSPAEQRYKVLLSLREDFVSCLDRLRQAMPSVMHNRFALTRMGRAQALLAVLRPGRGIVDEPVAEEIVSFVAGSRSSPDGGKADEHAEIEPALLNVICRELNTRRLAQRRTAITRDLLDASRGDILNDFYQRGFEGLDPGVRVFVEDHLLTGSGFRSTAPVEEALCAGLSEEAIRALVDRRLIRIEERLGIPHVELTHDVLAGVVEKSRIERRQREQAARREKEVLEQENRRKAELQRMRRRALIIGSVALLCVVLAIGATLAFFRARAAEGVAQRATEENLRDLVRVTWTLARYWGEDRSRPGWSSSYIQGARTAYEKIISYGILDLEKLQAKTNGVPIFLSGPHLREGTSDIVQRLGLRKTGGLNLHADEFGHYNPAFVRWARQNLIPASTDPALKNFTQPVYRRYLQGPARIYFDVYRHLQQNPQRRQQIREQYLAVLANHKPADHVALLDAPSRTLQDGFYDYAEQYVRRMASGSDGLEFFHVCVAGGFWIRRNIDGTDREFFALLEKLLETYDPQWLKRRRAG